MCERKIKYRAILQYPVRLCLREEESSSSLASGVMGVQGMHRESNQYWILLLVDILTALNSTVTVPYTHNPGDEYALEAALHEVMLVTHRGYWEGHSASPGLQQASANTALDPVSPLFDLIG